MEIETVKIVSPVSAENPLGYIVINASDLSNDHELFDDTPAKPEPKATAKAAITADKPATDA